MKYRETEVRAKNQKGDLIAMKRFKYPVFQSIVEAQEYYGSDEKLLNALTYVTQLQLRAVEYNSIKPKE